jgi:hypothetical protein
MFDHSWLALLRPDLGTRYFLNHKCWPFRADVTSYDPVNALWLSELSRWMYRHERDHYRSTLGANMVHSELEAIRLNEAFFYQRKGMQASLLVSSSEPIWAVLIFRGSSEPTNWFYNVKTNLVPWVEGGLVHQGFLEALLAIWEPINNYLQQLQGVPVFFCGHSLGGALATLAAADYKPSALYSYGSPRVGDSAFSSCVSGLPIYRVVNNSDIVSWLPPSMLPFGFSHIGELHYFSYSGNKYVNPNDVTMEYDKRFRFGSARSRLHAREWMKPMDWLKPPKWLSDHSPINYSANIYREVMRHPLYKKLLKEFS